MRRVSRTDATALLSWLTRRSPTPPATGYDPRGWADSIWLLHAMFERPEPPDGGSGASGSALGYAPAPGAPYRRLRWVEFAARNGLALDVALSNSSWFFSDAPARTMLPPEGSLDELSLRALIKVLGRHTGSGRAADCVAYYCPVTTLGEGGPVVFTGTRTTMPDLVTGEPSMRFTPTNLWPQDRSWMVFTGADQMATKVSGPTELIDALEADTDLETLRWHPDLDLFWRRHQAWFQYGLRLEHTGSPDIVLPPVPDWVGADVAERDEMSYGYLTYAGPRQEIPYCLLTEGERAMIRSGLNEWGATARRLPATMIAAMGFGSEQEYGAQISKLHAALQISDDETALDDHSLGLLVFLTELSFISDLIGSGVEFSIVCQADNPGIDLLRSIQIKLSSPERAALVFGQHARPRPNPGPTPPEPPEGLRHFANWMTGYRARSGDPLTRTTGYSSGAHCVCGVGRRSVPSRSR